jgi:hypothetical protein
MPIYDNPPPPMLPRATMISTHMVTIFWGWCYGWPLPLPPRVRTLPPSPLTSYRRSPSQVTQVRREGREQKSRMSLRDPGVNCVVLLTQSKYASFYPTRSPGGVGGRASERASEPLLRGNYRTVLLYSQAITFSSHTLNSSHGGAKHSKKRHMYSNLK